MDLGGGVEREHLGDPRDVSLHGFVISRATVCELADAARLINTMLATSELSARV